MNKQISFVFNKYLVETKEIFYFPTDTLHDMIKGKVLYQMVLNIVEQMIN